MYVVNDPILVEYHPELLLEAWAQICRQTDPAVVLMSRTTNGRDLAPRLAVRLGVGLGWNEVEYEALNEDFHTRGRRLAEQIEVMRLLWTQPVVDFHGQWHNVTEAGINPPPVQQPIPVWVGGSAEPALKRIAKVADGWFPNGPPDETRRAMVEMFKGFVKEAGRDMAAIGVEARLNVANGNVDDWRRGAEAWRSMGATHLSIMSAGAGFSLDDHIAALRQGKEAIADIIRA